ncbi:MAG: glycine C-acetyltransferase [Chloroflexi bacterium]|nr:glycine C-acetyltransferase [Chloroflexota bacterium]
MATSTSAVFEAELQLIQAAGTAKHERLIASRQGAEVVVDGRSLLNLCANNYLGLADHPAVLAAAHAALDERGYGLSSVRFICGTQDRHRELERRLAEFFGFDDAVLFGSCFDANGGVFEALLGEGDAIISDERNHASIIDGIRLCKAQRQRYAHNDMDHLRDLLRQTQTARLRLIATDGVFSMDGDLAPLDRIVELADEFDALVMVDDSHASGFIGPTGRGTAEHFGVAGRVDILTSTLGKALGGASGGFVAAGCTVAELLRQRARPYLFSNSLAPSIVGGSLAALDLLAHDSALRVRLMDNARVFRDRLSQAGFLIEPGFHPIVPLITGDAERANRLASDLFDAGIFVTAFSYPVVPRDRARIRVQLSALHTPAHIDFAAARFAEAGRRLGALQTSRA